MSTEHAPKQPETSAEQGNAELNELAQAQLEKIKAEREATPEAGAEQSNEARTEKAREALKDHEAVTEEPAPAEAAPAEPKPTFADRLDHHLNYRDTLASVQRKLTPISRSFSHVIHTPIVEKTSEALERNIARPSVLAGATWTALAVGSLFYAIARHYGFNLSGSELLFSFVVGALIGILLEGLWRTIRPHRH